MPATLTTLTTTFSQLEAKSKDQKLNRRACCMRQDNAHDADNRR